MRSRLLGPVLLFLTPALLQATRLSAEQTPSEIVRRVLPALVTIRGVTAEGEMGGSGFIVDPSGTIVTNLHLIRGTTQLTVALSNGDVYDHVRIRSVDERKDLAVIQIEGSQLPTLELGNSYTVSTGDPVALVGNPRGLEASLSTGVVSAIRQAAAGFRLIHADVAAHPGSSGGPVLDAQGRAIGVLTLELKRSEGLDACIPINYARGMLASSESMSLAELEEHLQTTRDLLAAKDEALDFPERWKSLDSRTANIVRVVEDTVYVETELAGWQRRRGGSSNGEATKEGDGYVGTFRQSTPCEYKDFWGGWNAKTCDLELTFELSTLSPTRIEGRIGEMPAGATLDCRTCRWSRPEIMKPFVWIPEG